MEYKVSYSVISETGYYRGHNEDNFLCKGITLNRWRETKALQGNLRIPQIFAVCDGMGGSGQGKEASYTAVKAIKQDYRILNKLNKELLPSGIDTMIKKVDQKVAALASKGSHPGCTLAMVYLHEDAVYLANVGDSRIYRYKNHNLTQLSKDHNQAQDMLELGITGNRLKQGKNKLTQYIGMACEEVIIQPHYEIMEYDDMMLLLCSDGLTETLNDETIEAILDKNEGYLKNAAEELIMEALKQGTKDNVTVMLIRMNKS